jgi:GMP synthase (glutamine-hydrolysing)
MSAQPSVLYLIHHPDWTDCRVADVLRNRGYRIDYLCHPAGEPLPANALEYAAIMVGGSEEGHAGRPDLHDWVACEIAFIRAAVEQGVPFLGICMGSQLLAAAFGGVVMARPDGLTELGFYPVEATAAGEDLFAGVSHFYQAHFEGVHALPENAILLARGERFPVQAYRIGETAYGLQFHPDYKLSNVTSERLAGDSYRNRLGAQPADEQIRLAPIHEASIQAWTERFVDRWVGPAERRSAA